MTLFRRQLSYALALFYLTVLMQESCAELATPPASGISNLYDNLLQREYAGPIVFPNHQVERKAQRSPSLRLRFGRSDPALLNSLVEKRWFGDVNQKPIRSPSLRLRFGRRSDPNMPSMRRSAYDDLLERELALQGNPQQQQLADNSDLMDYDVAFERVVRKPQRLRWGRSVPQFDQEEADQEQQEEEEEFERAQLYNSLLRSGKLNHMLQSLQQYDRPAAAAAVASGEDESAEFQREARKPMRLRWGRSTGRAPAEQKQTPPAAEAAAQTVEKSQN